MLRLVSVLILAVVAVVVTAEPIPVEHFAKHNEYHNVVISPDGKYLAVQRSAEQDKQLVAVIDAKEMKLLSHIPATTGISPFRPTWVNDTRLVVQFTEEFDSYEQEFANGELLSMEFNGKKQRRIIEHVSAVRAGGSKKPLNNLHGWARIDHLLPDEENHALIKLWEFGHTRIGKRPKIYKIHTTRGKTKFVAEAPSYDAYFTYSPKGELMYSVGIDKENVKNSNDLVVHKYENKKWTKLENINISDAETISIVAVTKNPNEVYAWAEYNDKPDKIYRYNMETGDKKLVFYHPKVDPRRLDIDRVTGELIAVHYDADYPNIHLVDQDHLYSRWYPALYNVFNGNKVVITSATKDGSTLVVHVSGANEPGQFHLFDTKTKKLRYLFNAASWVKTDSLTEVKPISYKARDGLEIHGYLTMPKSVDGKAPMVVMPHGGPHGPRDYWRYDREVQFLASRGYAVLQVNFRGSGGYGRGFRLSGYRKWGAEIQYDIVDGTKWAANLDTIDEDRICIIGASFGGYSALMSPTIEPDLYKCAISNVGLTDLNLMWSTADIDDTRLGKNYLMEAIGDNKEELNKFSPLHNIDKLKAPVFLAQGKKDHRVDKKHFEVMKAALEKKGHPHETMLVKKEGHGFASEENRIEYLTRVEAFLNKYIGK